MENGAEIAHDCKSDHSGLVTDIGIDAQLTHGTAWVAAQAAIGSDKLTAILHLVPDQCQSQIMIKEAVGPKRCAAFGVAGVGGLADATASFDGPMSADTQSNRSRS